MLTEAKYNQLIQDHEATYFRGEMAVANPSDYSIEEMEAISIDMDLSTVEMEETMRQDFQGMPPQMQQSNAGNAVCDRYPCQ